MKKNRIAYDIALSALAYFRTVVVITSLIAWLEHEWAALILSFATFGLTTFLINKTLDYPKEETLQSIAKTLEELLEKEDA
jgi:hypothetical protein